MVSSCGGTIGSQADRRLGLDEASEDDQQDNGSLGAAAKRLSSTRYRVRGFALGTDPGLIETCDMQTAQTRARHRRGAAIASNV
jgi:hypothetical protein